MKEFLNAYPIRACEFVEGNGIVTVLYKKEKLTIVEKFFFKNSASKPHKIDLDEVGSFIWKLCDGKKNIEQIIENTKEEFGDRVEPAKERVELFINQMNKTKLINLYKKVE